MDSFNKIISFILGLIVVVVLLVILTGRFNLREKFLPLKDTTNVTSKSGKTTPTPTPKGGTAVAEVIPTIVQVTPGQTGTYEYHSYSTPVSQLNATGSATTKGGVPLAAIPKTGAETALIPFALSSLAAGIYLRRKK